MKPKSYTYVRFESVGAYFLVLPTNIGDVLISVNPFRWLDIFGPEIINDYCGRTRIELPPHIYSIAEGAYRNMSMEKENQCVIIRYAVHGGARSSNLLEVANRVLEKRRQPRKLWSTSLKSAGVQRDGCRK